MTTLSRTADIPSDAARPLARPKPRRAFVLGVVALAWLPLPLLSLISSADGVDPLLLRAEPHARLLVALPLLVLAEFSLDRRIAMVARSGAPEQLLPRPLRKRWSDALTRVRRWRDARVFEATWLLVIYGALVLARYELLPDRALRWLLSTLHGADWTAATPAWWWYVLVAQPLLLMFLGRWLFRWGLWGALLWRLSRSSPDLRAAHGDGVGGLGFSRLPLDVLPSFMLALGIAIASVWFDEISLGKAQLSTFGGDVLGFLALCLIMMLLPYVALTPGLVRTRARGIAEYGELSQRYVREFEQRWLARSAAPPTELLGHADFQSLADLRDVTEGVETMRVVVPRFENLEAMLIAALLPFLIVALAHGPSAVQLVRGAVLRFIGA